MDKYTRTAAYLVALLGDAENVVAVTYCVTRLRITLADRQAVDDSGLQQHPAVLGRLDGDDALHLIVGPAAAAPLARACTDLLALPSGE
ncbi:PTS transporter subunit EIIB [Prauserella halophila]|uniref:PTS transporter subunit EIIB n=1 Tax=Prauserella halophila TaxID=185641 RepID=UPI0020A61280|nr:PTS transporter subunit EIIB [Prauserella halophila]